MDDPIMNSGDVCSRHPCFDYYSSTFKHDFVYNPFFICLAQLHTVLNSQVGGTPATGRSSSSSDAASQES